METSTEKRPLSPSYPTSREEPERARMGRWQTSHAEKGPGGGTMMSACSEQVRISRAIGGEA